jgi:hypothetical protein
MNVFVLIVVLQLGPYDFTSATIKYFEKEAPCRALEATSPLEMGLHLGLPIVHSYCEARIAI